jgi:two-component system, sporulation sensor kinase D
MNPYEQKRRWKFLLLAFAIIIAGTSLWYSNYLVKNIAVAERTRAEVWALSNKKIIEIADINDDYITFIYSIRDSLEVPAIVTNEKDTILYYRGLDTSKTYFAIDTTKIFDPVYFKNQLKEMKAQHTPIELMLDNGEKWFVYYKDSQLLMQLRVFPSIQLSVIGIFLLIAYMVFSSSRRSEQNLVWVGMAKETAHQLGTPISALMAWIELIKAKFDAENDPLVIEM